MVLKCGKHLTIKSQTRSSFCVSLFPAAQHNKKKRPWDKKCCCSSPASSLPTNWMSAQHSSVSAYQVIERNDLFLFPFFQGLQVQQMLTDSKVRGKKFFVPENSRQNVKTWFQDQYICHRRIPWDWDWGCAFFCFYSQIFLPTEENKCTKKKCPILA